MWRLRIRRSSRGAPLDCWPVAWLRASVADAEARPPPAACSGTLPAAWQHFPALERLVLYTNRLEGSLPHDLGYGRSFPRLTALDVSFNSRLSGLVPAGCALVEGAAGPGSCAAPRSPSPLETL